MKVIAELNDKLLLGQEGFSTKSPRRTARAILRNAEGRYAVMYAEKFGLYSLPGGGVEDDEDFLDALRREIREETGCSCDEIRELGLVRENRACQDYTQESYYFIVTTTHPAAPIHLTTEEQRNGTALQWHDFEDMYRLIAEPEHDTVQRKYLQARDVAVLKAYDREVELYVPKLEELWFNQKMLSDPATMSYNANWDVSYDGYHPDTGCIDFPETEWAGWYAHWIGQEPERFYAYIRRRRDGVWLGDINFHYAPEKDWWDMGIVLYAPYRGRGYAVPAMRLMLDHAFRTCGVTRIHNDFELSRHEVSAWQTHRAVGFKEFAVQDGFLQMILTREEYLNNM